MHTRALELFHDTWNEYPAVVASSPGRVNLIGEHTDYNDGFVLPMAINRRTAVALGPGIDEGLTCVSDRSPGTIDTAPFPWAQQPDGVWTNYVLGVLDGLQEYGVDGNSFRMAVSSNVLIGSGLSSSAALEAAVATAVAVMAGVTVSRPDVARLSQRAEHEYAGVRCGIMDQMASVMGQITMLDCRTLETRAAGLPDGVRVVILDSGIPRGLTTSGYNERRSQCEKGVELMKERYDGIAALRDVSPEMLKESRDLLPDTIYRRCRHVVSENRRVLQTVEALDLGDMATVGRLLGESHVSMRDDYEISLPEMDRLVEIAAGYDGCFGARLTGAGFGGAAVALVRESVAEKFAAEVLNTYNEETGRTGESLLVSADEGSRVDINNM